MGNRIEMRGIIVPSMYDCEYLDEYIQKGQIIPESRFRAAVANLAKDRDMELYINSQGGSVFAGSEMINSLLQWKNDTGRKINVIVGALAASMAANTIVQVADSVKVHVNSKIMFHGAFGIQIGGADAFKDYAELLDKINADVSSLLVQRYDISPDTVAEWFAEGREGWISSREAVQIGMASEIIGAFAEKIETPENSESLLNERGVKIAAVVFDKYTQSATKEDTEMFEKLMSFLFGKGLKAESDEKTIEKFVQELKTPDEIAAQIEAAKKEAEEAAELATIETLAVKQNEFDAKLAEAHKARDEALAKVETLETQAKADADARKSIENELAAANAKLANLSNGLHAPNDDDEAEGMQAFFNAVEQRMERDGIGREAATIAIQRENPELFQSMIDERNKN